MERVNKFACANDNSNLIKFQLAMLEWYIKTYSTKIESVVFANTLH